MRVTHFTKTLLLTLSTLLLGSAFLLPATSFAQFDPLEKVCADTPEATVCQEKTAAQAGFDPDNPNTNNPLSGDDGLLIRVANFLAIVTAVIAVIISVIAGLMMVLSSGDSGKVSSARDTIIYAAVGLVVVALARSILVFIVNRL
jgi:hypothetical protein